ncbi:MAG: preprotein translocase subunit SecA, partial [Leptospiraceae bacterium]|nr:preprotein translocase subunit SecA [Leptospiraceae bacterium]
MIKKVVDSLFGTKHERDIKKLQPYVDRINELEPSMQALSNEELAAQTDRFKARLADGETLDDILCEAFATVREVAWRTLGMRHFDVQMIGGMVLHYGLIAEMKTGEGKTLTSTGPVYLNALSGKGVHVVTVNDYLARRDAQWMKPIYDFLKVSVGIIQHNLDHNQRQAAYAADITYGTNNELGFDYLRDNMVTDWSFRVQRGFNYGIVDEVDSILIDEARTPLIISGPTEQNTDRYVDIDRTVRALIRDEKDAPDPEPIEVEPGKEEPHVIRGYYYDMDEKARNVLLTDEGVRRVEELQKIENLYAPENTEIVAHIHQALRAHLIYHNEVDYIVREGDVMIVDEHTGRIMEGRRYGDGLHQAIEAKERVQIKKETQTLASITFQNFFRMYPKLSGMTGTADTEAEEFKKIYNLGVTVIPTNEPIARIDHPDRVYGTEDAKWNAIIKEIGECQQRKQPVLVGTISVEKSEKLAGMLKKAGITHNVLNAKQHQREAEIVAQAGAPGSVTVATNMAGRGTDIVLGGAPQYTADLEELEDADPEIKAFKEMMLKKQFEAAKSQLIKIYGAKQQACKDIYDRSQIWLNQHKAVKDAGGLHIIGTERHESRRIDNQLRGRSGRQGDPGSSRFYLSLDDHLMRIFGGDRIKNIMTRIGMPENEELEARMVDRAIARAQKRVEGHNFDIRKHLLEYDEVMNRQRTFVYQERDVILANKDVRKHLLSWAEEVVEARIVEHCPGADTTRWDMEGLLEWLRSGMHVELDINADDYSRERNPQLAIFETVWEKCQAFYAEKVSKVGEENYNYVERRIALDVIDARWKEHLYLMDQLREGIWTVGIAQNNALVEFKLEGFRMFDAMVESIKEQIAEFIFRVQIEGPVEQTEMRRTQGTASHQSLNALSGNGQ